MCAAPFDHHKANQRHNADDQRNPRQRPRIGLPQPDRAIRQPGQTQRDQRRTGVIKLARRLIVTRFRHFAQRPDRNDCERQIDKKDAAPQAHIGEEATEHRR